MGIIKRCWFLSRTGRQFERVSGTCCEPAAPFDKLLLEEDRLVALVALTTLCGLTVYFGIRLHLKAQVILLGSSPELIAIGAIIIKTGMDASKQKQTTMGLNIQDHPVSDPHQRVSGDGKGAASRKLPKNGIVVDPQKASLSSANPQPSEHPTDRKLATPTSSTKIEAASTGIGGLDFWKDYIDEDPNAPLKRYRIVVEEGPAEGPEGPLALRFYSVE